MNLKHCALAPVFTAEWLAMSLIHNNLPRSQAQYVLMELTKIGAISSPLRKESSQRQSYNTQLMVLTFGVVDRKSICNSLFYNVVPILRNIMTKDVLSQLSMKLHNSLPFTDNIIVGKCGTRTHWVPSFRYKDAIRYNEVDGNGELSMNRWEFDVEMFPDCIMRIDCTMENIWKG